MANGLGEKDWGAMRVCAVIDRVNDLLGEVASYLTLLACLICAGAAAARYLFAVGSNGWLEIQWYMFGAIVLLGAAQTLRMNAHVRVDIVYVAISDRARLVVDLLGLIFILIPVCGYMMWLCWPMFWVSFISGEISGNPGGLIRWPVKLLFSVGFFFLGLQGLSEAIKRNLALRGRMVVSTEYEKPLQ